MANTLVRIGLIGYGGIGGSHLRLWKRTEGAQVTAVCDVIAERAEMGAAEVEAAAFTDLKELLKSGLCDAVDICTPSGLHATLGVLAAEHGLHVLSEKPLDLNVEYVDRLIRACDEHQVKLACIFQRRASRGARIVREAVVNGELGKIFSCSAYVKWYRKQSYYDADDWRGTWRFDGGVLGNQAIHGIDHLCWLCGRVVRVEYAHLETLDHQIEAEDNAIAVLRFENGASGVLEATTCCQGDMATRLEIYGANGSAAFDDSKVVAYTVNGESRMSSLEDAGEMIGGRSDPLAISLSGHAYQLQDFIRAIQNDEKPLVDGRDARMAVEALDLIYRKAFPNVKVGI